MDDLDGVLPNPLINMAINPTGPGVPALDPTVVWGGVPLGDRPPPSPMVSSFDPGSKRFALGANMLGANPAGVTALASTGRAMASEIDAAGAPDPNDPANDPVKLSVMKRIASGESPGYDVAYGGKKFSDFSDHPRESVAAVGPDGRMTHAAGIAQVQPATWDYISKKLGLSGFQPLPQRQGFWGLADDVYGRNTGRSLYEDAKAGKVDWKALQSTWPSLAKGPGPYKWPDDPGESSMGTPLSQGSEPAGREGGGTTVPQSMKSLVPKAKALEAPDWGPSVEDPESKSFAELLQNSTLKDNLDKLYPLMLLQSLAPKHKFTPVEYDPFKVMPKLT